MEKFQSSFKNGKKVVESAWKVDQLREGLKRDKGMLRKWYLNLLTTRTGGRAQVLSEVTFAQAGNLNLSQVAPGNICRSHSEGRGKRGAQVGVSSRNNATVSNKPKVSGKSRKNGGIVQSTPKVRKGLHHDSIGLSGALKAPKPSLPLGVVSGNRRLYAPSLMIRKPAGLQVVPKKVETLAVASEQVVKGRPEKMTLVEKQWNLSMTSSNPLADVKMWPMAFADVVHVLVPPTLLEPIPTCGKLKRFRSELILTQEVYNELHRQTPFFEGTTRQFDIVLRFCRNPPKVGMYQDDHYPSSLSIMVNGTLMNLPKCKKSQSKPIPLAGLLTRLTNSLEILWSLEDSEELSLYAPRTYLFSLYVCEKLSSEMISERISRNPWTSKETTISKILRLSSSSKNEDLTTEGPVKVSLICPISKAKIRVPGRGVACNHVSFFDVETFVQFSLEQDHHKLKCPMCNVPMKLEDLRVDHYFYDVLTTLGEEEIDYLEIDEEGKIHLTATSELNDSVEIVLED